MKTKAVTRVWKQDKLLAELSVSDGLAWATKLQDLPHDLRFETTTRPMTMLEVVEELRNENKRLRGT